MDHLQIFRIFSLVALAVPLLAEQAVETTTVDLTAPKTDIAHGDSFNFTCHMKNPQSGGLSFLRLLKYPKEDESAIILSTNSNLEQDFKEYTRYSLNHAFGDDGSLFFTFKALDAQYADSGIYSCALFGTNGIMQEEKVEIIVHDQQGFMLEMVVVPPAEVDSNEYRFTSQNPEHHIFELDDLGRFEIRITTSPTNPPPELSMFVGTQDITAEFNIEIHDVSAPPSDHPLLKAYVYGAVAHGMLTVDHSYTDGFTVRAKSGQVEEELSFSVKFSGFPPYAESEETCPTTVLARMNQENLDMKCSFLSSDEPEVVFSYDMRIAGGATKEKKFYPNSDDASEQYIVRLIPNVNETHSFMTTIRVNYVTKQMFRNHFLHISNKQGNFTQTITIEHDPNDPYKESPSAASSLQLVSISTLLLLAIATALSGWQL